MKKVIDLGKRATLKGVITADPETAVLSTNKKGTEYRYIKTKVFHDDGSVEETESMLYEKSRLTHADKFVVGAKIDVIVQMDGEYAGLSTVQLPGRERLNIDKVSDKKVWDAKITIDIDEDSVFEFEGSDKENS